MKKGKLKQFKAVLQVKPGSAYAHLNGQTFEVVEQCGRRTSVRVNHQTTDFYGEEVKVVYE